MTAYADLHLHSTFSMDGRGKAADIARTAFERGAKTIAFTEHYDIVTPGVSDPTTTDSRIHYEAHEPEAVETVRALQEAYRGKMNIVYAVELGQPIADPAAAKAFLDARQFDFVLGSIHNTHGGRDYYYVDYPSFNPDTVLNEYFSDILANIRLGMLDSVAHLDYPTRMMSAVCPAGAPMTAYRDIIGEILSAAAAAGLPMEINTNGLTRWIHRLHPEEWVLRLFRDVGGKTVTVGSDSHDVGFAFGGIAEGEALAESCGLKVIKGFKNREPIL